MKKRFVALDYGIIWSRQIGLNSILMATLLNESTSQLGFFWSPVRFWLSGADRYTRVVKDVE